MIINFANFNAPFYIQKANKDLQNVEIEKTKGLPINSSET